MCNVPAPLRRWRRRRRRRRHASVFEVTPRLASPFRRPRESPSSNPRWWCNAQWLLCDVTRLTRAVGSLPLMCSDDYNRSRIPGPKFYGTLLFIIQRMFNIDIFFTSILLFLNLANISSSKILLLETIIHSHIFTLHIFISYLRL